MSVVPLITLKSLSFLLPTKTITYSSNNNINNNKLVKFNSYLFHRPNVSSPTTPRRSLTFLVACSRTTTNNRRRRSDSSSNQEMVEDDSLPLDCVGTGLDVECVLTAASPDADDQEEDELLLLQQQPSNKKSNSNNYYYYNDDNDILPQSNVSLFLDWALLISPFFFWGTAMVAMKDVLPRAGPFFVSSFRLLPAGLLLVAFALSTGRKLPTGPMAWLSISLFALVDATCFQGFLALGLQKTSAGLGSVIIDSQPLTVAVLAALLFGESIGAVGVIGLVLGVVGLVLLEVPVLSLEGNEFSLWGSGEWWMLLAAQSMAVGTVMVRWVSKYSDPIMATGWHMVIGGIPLLVISVLNHDPVISGSLKELSSTDLLALLYTSFFGSAISYGVYFYNATRVLCT